MEIKKSFIENTNCLYVVATPIGNLNEMTPRAIQVLQEVDVIAAEDTRVSSKLLSHFNIHKKLISHHQHNEKSSTDGIIKLLMEGKNVAIVSDAGYPLLSDPGEYLRNKVIEAGFPIVPISGANAMMNALVASGLSTSSFLFIGFLPTKEQERQRKLEEVKNLPYTMIFYEAPHRMEKMLCSLLHVLGNRRICLAKELTKKHETFIRGNIKEILEENLEYKGEYVVVIEGSTTIDNTINIDDILEEVEIYINKGYSCKDAIRYVNKQKLFSNKELYQRYLIKHHR